MDGFNLYHGALRKRPYRWLNLSSFAQGLLKPYNAIVSIHYFTAPVAPTAGDPNKPIRQDVYLRARSTIPGLTITEGHFLHNPPAPPREKGSDVNLATQLLLDAFDDRFDVALVVSNDSDLATPIDVVVNRFGKKVGVGAASPHSQP